MSTLYFWHQRALGPPVLKFGRALRYERRALLDWAFAQTCQPA